MHFTFLKVSWSSLNYLLWASRNLQKNRDGVFWEKSISSEFEAENNRRIWFKLLEIDFSQFSFQEIFWKLVERCKSIYCESRATYRKILGGDCVVEVIFDEWPIIFLFGFDAKSIFSSIHNTLIFLKVGRSFQNYVLWKWSNL